MCRNFLFWVGRQSALIKSLLFIVSCFSVGAGSTYFRGGNGGRIVFGFVSCGNETETSSNEKLVTTIKSIVISAMTHGVTEIECHLFLEHQSDIQYFQRKIREFECRHYGIDLSIKYYDAMTMVPPKFRHSRMVLDDRYRCAYNRFYLPGRLPHVDSLIYLDTDVLITGNVNNLWQFFEKMRTSQMIGAAIRNDDFHLLNYRAERFRMNKTVNSGVLLMNLTKMREFFWEDRLTIVYEEKSVTRPRVLDQQILDILLHFYPQILYWLPCNYNMLCNECLRTTCHAAEVEGIQVIHGAKMAFAGQFSEIYQGYRNFPITNASPMPSRIRTELMLPLKIAYAQKMRHAVDDQERFCYDKLSRHLFQQYFP